MFNKILATSIATVGLMTVLISAAQARPLPLEEQGPVTLDSSPNATDLEIKQAPVTLDSSFNAMTWKMRVPPVVLGSKTYVLFGADDSTNPYQGDTSINEYRSLLCIKKTNAPIPQGLPQSSITPGGATKNSWSGGTVLVIPNIQGKQLTSEAVADNMCDQVGQIVRGTSGYRMAEFHDGTGPYSGWSFWAEAYGEINGLAPSTRYWVKINDQRANPWDHITR